MKYEYYISSFEHIFDFGKHRNEFLCDVVEEDPDYILWCAANIPEFGIHPDVVRKIRQFNKSIIFPDSFYEKIGQEEDFKRNIKNDSDSYRKYQERETYDRYNGSYAQDEMGYSDDEIDTIFDGDPLAYWNID